VTRQEIAPGTLIASRWIVGGLLGKSTLASVYEVEEAHQSRFAALKLFDPALREEPAWSEHVKLTTALAELPGDGLARAYDTGIDTALGRPYVASERLVFPTLARYVAERGAFKPSAFGETLSTLAGALDTAHGAGIVHGNLKPQNLFVSVDNPRWARLTDFCVGRLRAAAHAGPSAILGFSAPEAAAGFETPSSDRYSLALLTFFAIVGGPWHSAFRGSGEGKSPESARRSRIASERAAALGGTLDPGLDAWFSRALAADPSARFSNARDMVRAYGEALWSGPTVEVSVRSAPPPAEGRAPPMSMPLQGLAHASTLEMDAPAPYVAPGPVPAPAAVADQLPLRPAVPPVARVVVAGLVVLGVCLGLWFWLG